MITVIVGAIEGPILSVVSGCLSESGMQRLWLWNLVSTQVNMPDSDVSWKLSSILWYVRILVFLYCSGTLCRALVRGRDLDM